MTEKYKIYIPEEMRLRLLNDAELFDFYKKDDSVNLNGFLKELLLQYFDEYREQLYAKYGIQERAKRCHHLDGQWTLFGHYAFY